MEINIDQPYEALVDNEALLKHVLTKMLKQDPNLLIQICLEANIQIKSMQKQIDELNERLAQKDASDGN